MPIGEGWTGSARCAHCWNGKKGGPPKGNSALAPSSPARASITRRLQRSSGCSAPSIASGVAANALQPSRPAMPASTIGSNVGERAGLLALLEEESAARNKADSPNGGEHRLNLGAFHADRPARRRQVVVGSTRMLPMLVYIRTILRQAPV